MYDYDYIIIIHDYIHLFTWSIFPIFLNDYVNIFVTDTNMRGFV